MGNLWTIPSFYDDGGGPESIQKSIDVEEIPRLCEEMHARYASWARAGHWSIVAWYRKLSPDGTIDPQITTLASPACVIPVDPLAYILLDEQGDEMQRLDASNVAEFEDTMYYVATLSSAWKRVLEEGAIISA